MINTISIIVVVTGIVFLIKAIRNAYGIKKAISSIKNQKNLSFVKLNILLSISFIIGYMIFIGLVILNLESGIQLLAAFMFSLTAVFILIVSIVTREMGRLLYKIDKIRKLDSFTHIFNREQIEKKIAKEFSRCTRYKRNASLVMIDINNFKCINDDYGHQAGDKVIIDLVDTIKKEMRVNDIVGRYGGDEFILIMPETTIESAEKFSNRLSTIISNKKIIYDGNIIKYSVSFGLSGVDFSHSSYENWLKLTDTNLYKSKSKSDLPFYRS